jgi:GNAT superfamily N-acetyltransferase
MGRDPNPVRRGNAADADEVFSLARAFATTFQPERPRFDESFARLLDDETALLLVVGRTGDAVDGYLLGFEHSTFFANGPVAWVEEITVRADLRRHGLGSALMIEFERWAATRGASLVALATRRAADFYRALGFEESATYLRKLL